MILNKFKTLNRMWAIIPDSTVKCVRRKNILTEAGLKLDRFQRANEKKKPLIKRASLRNNDIFLDLTIFNFLKYVF